MDTHRILAEFFATGLMVLFGVGVNGAILLNRSKYKGEGELFAITAWGFGISVSLWIFGDVFINPSMAIAQVILGHVTIIQGLVYSISEILGGVVASIIIFIMYKDQFDASQDIDPVRLRTVFSTTPAIRNLPRNWFVEFFATFVFIFSILAIVNIHTEGMAPLAIGFLVWAIGTSLGGTTGFAMNLARDMGPRIAYALLPIKNKTNPDWQYGLIVPGTAPLFGGIIAALAFKTFF
ncbi:MAG: aquaporin family protein [Lactobacillaceae bacterium]|jgi:glycerol uptake facilitator protein|nr:aquaporin family protein [Lactobacillaceae bacterium]